MERETQRNLELIWLTGRLMPDFKTIADFRRDNGPAIRAACAQFIVLCRKLNLFTRAVVHDADQQSRRPGEARQKHSACGECDGCDSGQNKDGAKDNAWQQGEAQEMPGDAHRRSIDQGRKKERQDQIWIDVGFRQPRDEGRQHAHSEQQKRLRHSDQA